MLPICLEREDLTFCCQGMLTAHFHNLSRFRSPATVDADVGSPGQWNDSGDAIPKVNLDDVSFFLFKVEVRRGGGGR